MNYPVNQQEQYQPNNINMIGGYSGQGAPSMPMRGSVQPGGILSLGNPLIKDAEILSNSDADPMSKYTGGKSYLPEMNIYRDPASNKMVNGIFNAIVGNVVNSMNAFEKKVANSVSSPTNGNDLEKPNNILTGLAGSAMSNPSVMMGGLTSTAMSNPSMMTGLAGKVMGSSPLMGGLAGSLASNPSVMFGGLAGSAAKSSGGKSLMGGILGGKFF